MAARPRDRRGKRDQNTTHDTKLSKNLSWLLRHGAHEVGLAIDTAGFVKVKEILQQPKLKGYTVEDVRAVVENNDKQRFSLSNDTTGNLIIRANQGHSFEVRDLQLEAVDTETTPFAYHGTYTQKVSKIKASGLSRMSRQHIHMVANLPGEGEVISGMRKTCDVIIKVNVTEASQAGIMFYRSANGVILSPGNEDGVIPAQYLTYLRQ